MMDDNGQISVDFLVGISLFLITLTFTVQFIPGLFTSVSSGDESIGFIAYRTASILTEDSGWWGNGTDSGSNWEAHINDTMRIGMAADDDVNTRLTNTPNILNRSKVINLNALSEDTLVTKLGLYDDINGAHMNYGYNISITSNGNPLIINNTSTVVGQITPTNTDVLVTNRFILVEMGNVAQFNATEITTTLPTPSNMTLINITGTQIEDVDIRITNFNITGPNPQFLNAILDGTILNISADYDAYIKEDGGEYSVYSDPLNSTDTLKLVFDQDLFTLNTTYQIELNFNGMNFSNPGPPYTEYTNNTETLYKPAYLTVKVWR